MTEWLRSSGNDPSLDQLEAVAHALRRGGVAILPTDTIYGLHGSATDEDAIAKIFAAKRRPETSPLAVLCADVDQVRALGVSVPDPLLDALARLWPAPLTAILTLAAPIAASARRNTIAVRVPALPWLRELLLETKPLASTSVNVSGDDPICATRDIPPAILPTVDIVLDSGELRGASSTLVDFTTTPPTVVRAGAFRFTQNLWKSVWKTL